jgi:hypothetical protein
MTHCEDTMERASLVSQEIYGSGCVKNDDLEGLGEN